jgi:hypothetical protein
MIILPVCTSFSWQMNRSSYRHSIWFLVEIQDHTNLGKLTFSSDRCMSFPNTHRWSYRVEPLWWGPVTTHRNMASLGSRPSCIVYWSSTSYINLLKYSNYLWVTCMVSHIVTIFNYLCSELTNLLVPFKL